MSASAQVSGIFIPTKITYLRNSGLTRNTVRVSGDHPSEFDLLTEPTPTQRRAFELLGVTVPARLQ